MNTIIKNLFNRSKSFLGLTDDEEFNGQADDSQFAALFFIRNINVELAKDLADIVLLLKDLEDLNKKVRSVFTSTVSGSKVDLWEAVLDCMKDHVLHLSLQISYLKDNISKNSQLNDSIFWNYNQYVLKGIKDECYRLAELGLEILPESERMYWRTNVCEVQTETIAAIELRINICKQQFDFIKKFTPKEANTILQTRIGSTPNYRTPKETQKYEMVNNQNFQ